MEPEIRKGAMQMIIFEELVYQEAERRKMSVPPAKMEQAMAQFKKQFKSPDEYQAFMKTELGGSQELLRAKIRRSLLIDEYLKQEVQDKAVVSVAEAKAYYDKNPDKFGIPESYSIQSISIIPPRQGECEPVERGAEACRGRTAPSQGDQELRAVWSAGGEDLRRQLSRHDGRS